jgi:DNA-binding response OmpR family regulator
MGGLKWAANNRRALVSPADRDRIDGSPGRGIVKPKRRILVVEPNDLILGLLERWLGEAGYTVVVRTLQSLPQTGGEGGEPHLIVIDVPAPRSAEKTIKSVREVHAGPILLLSARFRRGMGSSMSVARQLGVRNVLPKPFTRGELLSAVGDSIDGQ